MKTTGWIFIVFGVLAFLGAALKGNSVFGPCMWIAIGGALIYFKKEKEENKTESKEVVPKSPKETTAPIVVEDNTSSNCIEQSSPVTFEQKEAVLCLIAFFAGYNDDLTTDGAAYMVSYQAAVFFGIDNYKETLVAALPKYQDADKLIDTILTIKDVKSKEFILLTCYDLTKMSGKSEAYEFLYNIANDMGFDKEKLHMLIKQYSTGKQ